MNWLIDIIGIIIAGAFGFWLRQNTKDELKPGRRWFKIILITSFIGIILFEYFGNEAAALTCAAILIVAGISLKK